MQSPFLPYPTHKKYSLRCTLCGGARFPSSASTQSATFTKTHPEQAQSREQACLLTLRFVGGGGGGGVICREYSEGGNEAGFTLTIENHDGSDVSASIAVIWRTPDGDEVLIEMVFVPLHDKLMSTCNQR